MSWEEGKAPDVVIEITSKTTRRDDQHKKRLIYRDVLKVPEFIQSGERSLEAPDRRNRVIGPPLWIQPPLGGFGVESLLHSIRTSAALSASNCDWASRASIAAASFFSPFFGESSCAVLTASATGLPSR